MFWEAEDEVGGVLARANMRIITSITAYPSHQTGLEWNGLTDGRHPAANGGRVHVAMGCASSTRASR